MKTIMVCGQKGGIGKTTVVTNLAATLPGKTAIIDMDVQGSAVNWANLRARNGITPVVAAVKGTMADLGRLLMAAESNGIDFCLIDTVGTTNAILGEAARHADLIVIPTQPNSMDINAIGTTLRLLNGHKARQIVVLNMVRSNLIGWIKDDDRAVNAIRGYGGEVAPVRISTLREFSEAIAYGQAAHEYKPHGKGAAQIAQLAGIASGCLSAV